MKPIKKILNYLYEKDALSFIASAITLFWVGYILKLVVENSSTLGKIFIGAWGCVLAIWYLATHVNR